MPQPQTLLGSIGWEDEDEYVFFGEDANDGYTFVRVQLFDGRDISKPLNPDRAQGHKIICHIPDHMFRVPKKDTRCYVAIPHGMEGVPGIGVIVACVSKSPTTQFDKDRAVLDFGPDAHVVIRGKSVTLQDPEFRFVSVGTPKSGGAPGITVQASDGSGGIVQEGVVSWFVASGGDAKSLIQMTPAGVEIMQKESGFVRLKNGEIVTMSKGKAAYIAANTFIGRTPVGGLPAAIGPQPGLVSTAVFIGLS